MADIDTYPTTGRPPKLPDIKLALDSLETVQADLAAVTRAYMRGEVSDHIFRAFVYSCNSQIKLLSALRVRELEARIKRLEESDASHER